MGQKDRSSKLGDGDARDHGPESPAWQTCGSHRFYIHNDVLFWETNGPMEISDFVVLYDQRRQLQHQNGYVLLLFDARLHGGVPAEARRYLVTYKPEPPPRGSIVVFGSSLLVRTVVSLIQGAARKLGRSQETQLIFAEDEAASWALLGRERHRLHSDSTPRS